MKSELPSEIKDDANIYLSATEKAVSKENPKKDVAIVNLKQMTETLDDASKTVDAGKTLIEKITPILEKITPWFGIAIKNLF